MFRIGAHVSSSGSVAKAVEREQEVGGTCGQLFVGSPRTWKAGDPSAEEADAFKEAVEAADVRPWIVHGTYLINLATPKADLAEKSVNAVQAEIDAAAKLGIPYYVFHPGAHTGAGRETGVENIAERISQLDIPDGTMLLLENTAGKGTTLGTTFAELDSMVRKSRYTYKKVGVCLDTCHLYAAGYDFTSGDGMERMVAELEAAVGLDNVHYLHLNDSKHPLGSEKDEHEHIGQGEVGEEGFRNVINHDAFNQLPMVVETPDHSGKGFAWNIEKVKALREGEPS